MNCEPKIIKKKLVRQGLGMLTLSFHHCSAGSSDALPTPMYDLLVYSRDTVKSEWVEQAWVPYANMPKEYMLNLFDNTVLAINTEASHDGRDMDNGFNPATDF